MLQIDQIFEFFATLRRMTQVNPDVQFVQAELVSFMAYLVVSAVLSWALRPTVAKPKPAAFEDFDFPQSTEGTAQGVVFGDVWLDGWMVLGVGNYRITPIVK